MLQNNKRLISIVLAMLAVILLVQGSYIHLKAMLAQYLIASAWQQSSIDKQTIKPWPWADTWPVAQLIVANHDIEQYVLAGINGQSLAFGPAYMQESAKPATQGHTLIAAHRDTHFRFLKQLQKGETIVLKNREGQQQSYQVESLQVVDKTDLATVNKRLADYQLTLVTCYPFDSVAVATDLRYVVTAIGLSADGDE